MDALGVYGRGGPFQTSWLSSLTGGLGLWALQLACHIWGTTPEKGTTLPRRESLGCQPVKELTQGIRQVKEEGYPGLQGRKRRWEGAPAYTDQWARG